MNERHMHIKKIVIPTITMAIICSQLLGCGAMSQSDLLKMINNGDTIEVEIAVPDNLVETNEDVLAWIILASLTSQQTMRDQWDDTLKITLTADGKQGCLYVDTQGNNENNNTLRVALHNRAFISLLEDKDIMEALANAANEAYTDIDATEDTDKAFYMALNAYFNILPDSTDGSANANDALSRKEFMTMVARSELQVDDSISASDEFNTAVGSSEFNAFAEKEAQYSYLDLGSKSLNNKTYNGVMSRGEAIYLIVNHFFADDLAKVGNLSAQFTDCRDGGNIAEKQKFIENGTAKDYYRDYELVYALQNPDDGCPSSIYNAMLVARNKNLIGDETRWDEGITKYEAIKLIVEALKTETGIEQFNYSIGTSADAPTSNTADNTEVVTESDMGNGGQNDLSDDMTEEEMIAEIAEEDEIEVPTPEYTIEPIEETKYYAIQTCNVRSGPSTDYDTVRQLAPNEEIIVNGRVKAANGKNWCVIKTEDGSIQMVSGSLISTEKIATKKPSSNSGSTQPSSGNTSTVTPAPAPSDCSADCDYGDCEGDCSADCGGGWTDAGDCCVEYVDCCGIAAE